MQQNSFSIRLTKSRLDKELLAIPKKYAHLFPPIKTQVDIIFDDGEKAESKSYLPDDSKSKENRLFGLGRWFDRHKMKPGDVVTITVVNDRMGLYRLALDRYLVFKEETKERKAFLRAPNDEAALDHFAALAKITKRRRRRAAKEELLDIVRNTSLSNRLRAKPVRTQRRKTVEPAMRVLLGELHQAKCQICSFTFKKRDGELYFEVHHIEAEIGDHPTNLLVLCPNCHAQFEHAEVANLERSGDWLVAVRINGKKFALRQPLRTVTVHSHLSLEKQGFSAFGPLVLMRLGELTPPSNTTGCCQDQLLAQNRL